MREITYRMNLDVQQGGIQQTLMGFRAGDSLSRTVCIHLVERGATYQVPTDCTVTLYAEKPDGTVSYSMCTVENGYLQHTFTSGELAVPGEVLCEVRIISGDSNPVIVSCPQFAVVVEDVLHSDAAIESTNEYSALVEMTAELGEKKAAAQEAATAAENAAQRASAAAVSATTAADAATAAGEEAKLLGVAAAADALHARQTVEAHVGNADAHITAAERAKWNAGRTYVLRWNDSEHIDNREENEPVLQELCTLEDGKYHVVLQSGGQEYPLNRREYTETNGYLYYFGGTPNTAYTASEYVIQYKPANTLEAAVYHQARNGTVNGLFMEEMNFLPPTTDLVKIYLDDHANDTDVHVTAEERAKWNAGGRGEKGDPGEKGERGDPGKSAYEVYAENGGTLTQPQWLASLAQGAPEFADDITGCTDTSKIYVLPDGHLWAYMAVQTALYTNQISQSKDDTGAVLNGVGYQNDARYNSSGAAVANTGSMITGKIPVKYGDVIRFSGAYIEGTDGSLNTFLYKADGTQVMAFTPYQWNAGTIAKSKLSPYTYENQRVSQFTVADTSAAFIKFTLVGSGKNAVITINEEITQGVQGNQYRWADTGLTYTPADYEDRILTAESSIDSIRVKLEALETGEGTDQLPPEYWIREIENKGDSIKERQESGTDAFQFVWFSDMHGVTGYANQNGAGTSSQTNIGKVSRYLCDRFDIPYVATSGDIMSQASHSNVQNVYNEYKNIHTVLSPIPAERLLAVRGNHDGSWGEAVNGVYYLKHIGAGAVYNEIYREQAQDGQRVFGGDGTYFYADSVPHKVRFIMLNSNTDGDGSNDASGNAVYNSQKVSVYGTEQLAWLGDVALHMPAGWTAVIMAHQPPDTSGDGALLAGMIEAYNSREAYSGTIQITHDYWGKNVSDNTYKTVTVDMDFTESEGEIAAFFHGHIHKDTVDTQTYAFPCISITTAGGDVRDSSPAQRTPGTATETAIDVVTLDKAARRIYMTRVGVGMDRSCSY